MPSPSSNETLLIAELRERSRCACRASAGIALDREDLRDEMREQHGLISGARPDLEHLLLPVSSSSSRYRACIDGCEIVWPLPIGSGASS